MTCEIAIMNRQAIALAADSALTITRWVDGREEARWFKGANKIFQLSNTQPVALMVYDTATLHQVPWEIIIKDFRAHIDDTRLGTLENYASELFAYISLHYELFPREYQISLFKEEAIKAGAAYFRTIAGSASFLAAATPQAQSDEIAIQLGQFSAQVAGRPLPPEFSQQFVDDVRAQFGVHVGEALANWIQATHIGVVTDAQDWAALSINSIFRDYGWLMEKTGVVVAGYGDNDYFPSFHEFECYGFLLGALMKGTRKSRQIDLQNLADISAFATNDNVTTFMFGQSDHLYSFAGKQCEMALQKVRNLLGSVPHGTQVLDQVAPTILADFSENLVNEARVKNYWPLIRVIGSLAKDEMASLAETLIMIESLKEKVTKPTESVSGPIDVAVISKADGFVWVKRKHYFDPNLNPRYFQRMRRDD